MERSRVIDFGKILSYAGNFPEMKILSRSTVNLSRLHRANTPGVRPIESFLGLRPGMTFGGGWKVDSLALRGDEVDAACSSPDGRTATFFAGPGDRGPSCPFDRPGIRVGYHPGEYDFNVLTDPGAAFADLAAATVAVDADTWDSAVADASFGSSADGLSADERRFAEVRPDGKVYVRLTNDCQERCAFCFYYGTPQEIGDDGVSEDAVTKLFQRLDPVSTTQIILTGGEPTLVPGFENLLQLLLDRGFQEIVVQTNGLLTDKRGFLDRFAASRERISFGFSLHAATAATSATLTGAAAPSNFACKTESIRRAVALGYVTKITCVLSTLNLPELNGIVDFCTSMGDGKRVPDNVLLQFSMPVLRGRMSMHMDMAPRLKAAGLAVRQAMDRASAAGLLTSLSSLCSLPPCTLPDHLEHLESMWYREGPTEWWESERAFGPQCGECVLKGWCSGVSPVYLQEFGTDELLPFLASETEIVMPQDDRGPGC